MGVSFPQMADQEIDQLRQRAEADGLAGRDELGASAEAASRTLDELELHDESPVGGAFPCAVVRRLVRHVVGTREGCRRMSRVMPLALAGSGLHAHWLRGIAPRTLAVLRVRLEGG